MTRLREGGGLFFHPRSRELLDRFTKSKRLSIGLKFYPGEPKVVDLEVNDRVTGQIEVKMFTICHVWFCRYNRTKWKQVNKTTWIVSVTLLSKILSFR